MSMLDLGQDQRAPEPTARLASPIVPRGSIAGRALIALVAIMTFLASLATGVVLLVRAAATEWQADVASELTVQVRPVSGRELERDVARALEVVRARDGIVDVRAFSVAESAGLLEPWLGSGVTLNDLPVPRMIIARIVPGTSVDLAALRTQLAEAVPTASLDDHRAWIERMRAMTGATLIAGLGILGLVIFVTVLSVSFATRGAMAANRPIVEVLHFVGASDRYIANRFLGHFLRLGLEGGLLGVAAAMLVFGLGESISGWFAGTPAGDQFAALLGTFSLRPSGYVILAIQALLIAATTAWSSRRTLFATLEDIE